jgi:hypothetical protein
MMRMYDVVDYRACATSAMRDAKNGKALIKKIEKKTGIRIDLIEGKERKGLKVTVKLTETDIVENIIRMLKQVALYNIEPDTLFLGESNSESHTHGLCYAIGKDEWAKKIRYKDGEKRKKEVHNFTKDEKILLESEAEYILEKLLESNIDVDRFYIETVACAYKKLFRNNDSRYVGYYLDRQAEDIIKLERENWYGVDWKLLWDARRELLNKNHLHTKVDTRKFSLPYEEKIQLPKEMKCNMIQSILHGDLK